MTLTRTSTRTSPANPSATTPVTAIPRSRSCSTCRARKRIPTSAARSCGRSTRSCSRTERGRSSCGTAPRSACSPTSRATSRRSTASTTVSGSRTSGSTSPRVLHRHSEKATPSELALVNKRLGAGLPIGQEDLLEILRDLLVFDDQAGIAIGLHAGGREVLAADDNGARIDNEALVMHGRLQRDIRGQVDPDRLHLLGPFLAKLLVFDQSDIHPSLHPVGNGL